jgi:hypothetical protein
MTQKNLIVTLNVYPPMFDLFMNSNILSGQKQPECALNLADFYKKVKFRKPATSLFLNNFTKAPFYGLFVTILLTNIGNSDGGGRHFLPLCTKTALGVDVQNRQQDAFPDRPTLKFR